MQFSKKYTIMRRGVFCLSPFTLLPGPHEELFIYRSAPFCLCLNVCGKCFYRCVGESGFVQPVVLHSSFIHLLAHMGTCYLSLLASLKY